MPTLVRHNSARLEPVFVCVAYFRVAGPEVGVLDLRGVWKGGGVGVGVCRGNGLRLARTSMEEH